MGSNINPRENDMIKQLIRIWRELFRSRAASSHDNHEQVSRPVAWSSMAGFLEDIEKIGDQHPELFDTDVREQMWAVVERVLIKKSTAVEVPDDLGMFTSIGNKRLKDALEFNLQRLCEVFDVFELNTETARLNSFFNPKLRTERGNPVDHFFGHP